MNAVPKGSKKPRRIQIDILAESRGYEPDYQLPDTYGDYLISTLSEIGEAKVSGDRIISIDWNDIKAWIDVTGAIITPGEAEALRHLSSAYVSQYYDAMDDNCAAPHIKEINNDAVENKLKNLFAILRN